jgi:hypothetical protein
MNKVIYDSIITFFFMFQLVPCEKWESVGVTWGMVTKWNLHFHVVLFGAELKILNVTHLSGHLIRQNIPSKKGLEN